MNVSFQLSPIERYAMRFIEETESAWSAEQLAAAEREIEESKREWERNRLAAMKEEEERRARELEEENDMITFSREDATNQVSTVKNKKVDINSSSSSTTMKKCQKRRIIIKNRKKLLKNPSSTTQKLRKLKNSTPKKILHKDNRSVMIAKAKFKARNRRRKLARKCSAKIDVVNNTIEETTDESQNSTNLSSSDGLKVNGDETTSSASSRVDDPSSASDDDAFLVNTAISTNHVDHNSPRTRSRGTVAINLWTLDVSPILPGVKPVKKTKVIEKSEDDGSPVPVRGVGRPRKKPLVKKKPDEIPTENDLNKENDGLDDLSSHDFEVVGVEKIHKGKICKVMLNDIIAGKQLHLTAPQTATDDQVSEVSAADSSQIETDNESSAKNDGSIDSEDLSDLNDVKTNEISENIADTKLDRYNDHLDNGLSEKKINKVISKFDKKFAKKFKTSNNTSLDDWVVKDYVQTGDSNDTKDDSSVDDDDQNLLSLKRSLSEAEIKDSELENESKIIKTGNDV